MHIPKCGAIAIAASLSGLPFVAGAAPGTTELISVRDPAIKVLSGNAESVDPSISADGRFIAFSSGANDFVPGDTNQEADVFVYERATGAITRVSVSSNGEQGNGFSVQPRISADGRYVAFSSAADNLVSADTNGGADIFVHDRQTGITTRDSLSATGEEPRGGLRAPASFDPAISADGRFVAFTSFSSNLGAPIDFAHVYLRDRQLGATTMIDRAPSGDEGGAEASISADGRYIAFSSGNSTYVANDTNQTSDIFVRDRQLGTVTRVSVASNGAQSNGLSFEASISADGRYVAFLSAASNLVTNDTNAALDVFVHDRQSGVTQRVSVGANGAQAVTDDPNIALHRSPSISANGRYVAFQSRAANLVAGDTNASPDIFVRDRQANVTTRVSLASNGTQADGSSDLPVISSDGRFVVFGSVATSLVAADRNLSPDVFLRELQASSTTLVSRSKLPSQTARGQSNSGFSRAASATGRFVAFESQATLLVDGDTNKASDVFVRDRQSGVTTRVSVSSTGEQGLPDPSVPSLSSNQPSISSNGRYVAFVSGATNLVPNDTNEVTDVFVHDRQTRTTSRASISSTGVQSNVQAFDPSISLDGRYVAFSTDASTLVAGDSNPGSDIFVHDRQSGTTRFASVSSQGQQSIGSNFRPSTNGDGRFVAFVSTSSNLVANDTNGAGDVFVHDMQTGSTTRVSVGANGIQGDLGSASPSISADGRYVAFQSSATNLVPGDTNSLDDIFVHDRQTGITRRSSIDSTGAQSNGGSDECIISANGRYVTFTSFATNLAPGDTPDDLLGIYVHDRLTGTTQAIPSSGVPANGPSRQSSLSGDGRVVVFTSFDSNLVPNDLNEEYDVFAHVRRDIPVLRLNVGGAGFTDSQGHFWEADRNFNTGGVSTFTSPIANTNDDVLYQTERWDPNTAPELQYSLAVPNGVYLVRLHFAENYAPNFGVGRRIFDVDMEGVLRFDNIDIFREAGARSAVVKSASVSVSDGQLNILFRHQTQNPIIDAIEVMGQ